MKKDTKIIFAIHIFVFIAGVIALITGCKQKLLPIENIAETIMASAKPLEDSLRREIKVMKTEIDSLKIIAAKASVKKEVIRERVVERPIPTTDSGALIAYNDLKNDFDLYVISSDEQALSQGNIIIKQERIITNLQADVELQKSKFTQLKSSFNIQETQLNYTRAELTKNVKKLKRARFFNKVFGVGTAAGVGLAAFIFL